MPALHKSRDDLHQSGTSTPKLRSNIIPLTRVYDVQLGKQNAEGGRDRQAAEDYKQRQNKQVHAVFFLTSCVCLSVSWDHKLMINILRRLVGTLWLLVVWLEKTTFDGVIWTLDRKPSGLSNPAVSLRNLSQIRRPQHISNRWPVESNKGCWLERGLSYTLHFYPSAARQLKL